MYENPIRKKIKKNQFVKMNFYLIHFNGFFPFGGNKINRNVS